MSISISDETALNKPCVTIKPWKIFLEFARLSIMGFGGVLPLAYHSIVERNHWLNDKEFIEILSIGQMLPGGNVVNLSVMLGWRFSRLKGACAAFMGLLLIPTVILLCVAMLYHSVRNNNIVSHAVIGMASVAAGLVLATGLKLALRQSKKIRIIFFSIIIFIMIIVFHLPLAKVLICIIPIALLTEMWSSKNS